MKTPALLALVFATTALAACDSQGGDDDLVGTYTRLRANTTEIRDQWAFMPGGVMTFDENKPDARAEEDHVVGPYTASDGVVTATVTNTNAPGHVRVTFTYYVGATVFSTHALLAPAGHDGIVGVWTQSAKLENLDDPSQPADGATATREFRADGTFHWVTTRYDDGAVTTFDGTWVANSADTFTTTTTDGSSNVIKLVDGEALIPDGYSWLRQ